MTALVAAFGLAGIAFVAIFSYWLSQRAITDTRDATLASFAEERAGLQQAILDERHGYQAERQAWHEERMLLLDRLTDREGRQLAPFMPQPASERQSEPVPMTPVRWDDDLVPLGVDVDAEQGGE